MQRTVRADLTAALDLLDRSHATLEQAAQSRCAGDRYIQAHLGALRAGAALMAARPAGRGAGGRRGGIRNVSQAVAASAPELGEWSAYLSWCTHRRQAIETEGAPAGQREADDLLRAAATFVGLIEAALGVPARRSEPLLMALGPG